MAPVRLAIDDSRADDDNISTSDDDWTSPTPTSTADAHSVVETNVSDPSTAEGQRVGAILAAKWYMPYSEQLKYVVGDRIEILGIFDGSSVKAKNLRTLCVGFTNWSIFFPKKIGVTCDCLPGFDHCIIEDPLIFYAYKLALEGFGTFPPQTMIKEATSSTTLANTGPIIADPTTLAGQTPGCLLIIKQKAQKLRGRATGDCPIEVGDYVKFLARAGRPDHFKVHNLRTDRTVTIPWDSVLPVSIRSVCDCVVSNQNCRCDYKDYVKSIEHWSNRGSPRD